MFRCVTKLAGVLVLVGAVAGQAAPPRMASVTAVAKPATVARGGQGVLTITITVASGFHINSAKPGDPSLIATTFHGVAPAGITLGSPRFPAAKRLAVAGSKPLSVYTGRAVVSVPYRIARTAKPRTATLGGSITYQACNAQSCFPPVTVPVQTTVTIR